MGLFSGNYSKAGPEVSKDALEKNRFFLFFELLGRKFSKMIPLNMMYFVTLLPLALGVFLSLRTNPAVMENGALNAETWGKVPLIVFSGDIVGLVALAVSLFVTGPATCGFTYVLRNMQRQEHAWVFSDFREHFAKNFKQGVAMSVIDLTAAFLLYVAFCFYAYTMPVTMPGSSALASVAKYFIIVLSAVFAIMHFYIYTMIVTFDMKLKDIFKNALIFTFAKLPINILLSAIIVCAVFASLWYTAIGVICAFVFTLSLLAFLVIFCIYPSIDKTMIKSQLPQENEETEKDFEDVV